MIGQRKWPDEISGKILRVLTFETRIKSQLGEQD